jgi:hypothetical protein
LRLAFFIKKAVTNKITIQVSGRKKNNRILRKTNMMEI